jgi:hypothetical protein
MEQQIQQQVEQQLRTNWSHVRHQILDTFPQVSTADVNAATSVTDLVQRISDKTGLSNNLVESRIRDIAGDLGNGQQRQQPFGQPLGSLQPQQQYAGVGSGQSFGSGS